MYIIIIKLIYLILVLFTIFAPPSTPLPRLLDTRLNSSFSHFDCLSSQQAVEIGQTTQMPSIESRGSQEHQRNQRLALDLSLVSLLTFTRAAASAWTKSSYSSMLEPSLAALQMRLATINLGLRVDG